MAGEETEYTGEAWAAEGATVGFLAQEPELDPSKTVAENVMEGLAEQKGYVDRFEEVSMKLGEVTDTDEMTALIDEQADLQEKIDAADAWDLSRTVEIAMDALRCADGEAEVMQLSGCARWQTSGSGSQLARGPGRRNQRRGLPPTKNCWQTARVTA